jgi:alpha-D-xyloside xylohydrolase
VDDQGSYVKGASTCWYFYYGPDMLDVIDRYTEHVSRPALPPPWAVFSTWQWRDANSEAGARSDVAGMQDAGIPLSLIWLDRPWATGGQGMPPPFKWNGSYPNGAKMTQDFLAKGVKTGVWVAENGYVGAYNSKSWMKESDVKKLTSDITGWLAESTVQMYKIDRGNLQSFAPYFTTQAYWEAWHSVYGDDFVTLPRVVSHYGQKYISGKWPGDNAKSLGYGSGGMAANIPALLNFGIAGFPHWGSDTGGFPDVSGNAVTTRWAQFSSMCPIFQTCGQPHNFGANTAIYKKYAILYTQLFPYRWTYTVLAHEKGHPTNRAMALHYPDDPKGYNQDGEMFLGYWLLAAPMRKVSGSRDVYLPEGEWIDW